MFSGTTIPPLGVDRIGGTPTAVLHLFSPRIFSNQGKRPMMYKLDNEFIPAAVEAIETRASSQNSSKIISLTQNPYLMQSIVPSFMPDYMLNMGGLAHQWTFLLVINNDKTSTTGGITMSMSDNLQLCYGYFLEEPINPNSHMGRVTPNLNATLMITHKTMVNKSNAVGPYGTTHRLDTMSDIDIIPTNSMAFLSSAQTVVMRPEDLYESVSSTREPRGDLIVMHDQGKLLSNMNTSLGISSKLSLPNQNIKKILDSVADAQSSAGVLSYQGASSHFLPETYDDLLGQNLQDGAARHIEVGLPTNQVITMGFILTRYNPSLNPVYLPNEQRYATQDQSHGSARTVFSSMLASVLPSMMASFVLARIAFQYDSSAEGGSGAFRVDGVDSMTAMTPGDVQHRVQGLLFRLRSEIFEIMKLQRGDFTLSVNCDCINVTHIVLNFYADSIRTGEVFEVPTILGGFNNPLIATANTSDANSRELAGFLNVVRGTDRDVSMGSYDTSSYNRSLIGYDENQAGYHPSNNQPYDPTRIPPGTNSWNV